MLLRLVYCVCVCVSVGGGFGVELGVELPLPHVRNDIVTPRHSATRFVCRSVGQSFCRSVTQLFLATKTHFVVQSQTSSELYKNSRLLTFMINIHRIPCL